MMGDHRMLGKGGFFDGSYHIPLIVRDPSGAKRPAARSKPSRKPSTSCRPRSSCSAANVPAHLDGRSLAPFLDGETPDGWRDAAHWEFDFRSISKAQGGEAFRHRLAPMQSRRRAH